MKLPKYFYLIVLLLPLLFPLEAEAQTTGAEKLRLAFEAYRIGRFDTVLNLLDASVEKYTEADKVQAYRLRSLSALALDDTKTATADISRILQIEPYYSASLNDPPAYARLVKEMQSGKQTLVTASQLTETLEEVPVPVSLITAKMIQESGARSLKEALTWFVPGMTAVESANEVNVSMRGIYSSSQQKILIMINGHRLNSRTYNNANPDFSISLEKVKQIEVLRGPASSLYGNVALTAVVNIITKEGIDVDGLLVKAGIGSYGERRADILAGKRLMNLDVMAWGSFYRSKGQYIYIPESKQVGPHLHDGNAIVGGYRDKPSYDYGMVFKWNNFKLLFNQRYGKMIEPFASIVNFGETYDYDKYYKFEGKGPGASFSSTHSELSYQKSSGPFAFDAALNLDFSTFNIYTAVGDSALLGNIVYPYIFQTINWSEYTYGGIAKAGYNYQGGKWGKGNAIFGIQWEQYKVYGHSVVIGENYTQVFDAYTRNVLDECAESSFSAFLQEKHYFTEKLIFNAGVRYDLKFRANDKKVQALSPRVSLIYLPSEKWTLKASYSKSFVDAPYYYRFNAAPSFLGGVDLNPEKLNAIQLSSNLNFRPIGLNWEVNLFYDHLTDFIYNVKSAVGTDPKYVNAGKLNTLGIENTLQYSMGRFNVLLNVTWQNVLSGEKYSFKGNKVYNVPSLSGNLLASANLFESAKAGKLSFHASINFASRQLAPLDGVRIGGIVINDMDNFVKGRVIAATGINYQWKSIGCSIHCNNLFNTKYYQGGTSILPYPQAGRWISASVSYKF